MTSSFLNEVIPNFESVFGKKHDDISLVFSAVGTPEVSLWRDSSTVATKLEIKILNPYEQEYEAFVIDCTASADLKFELANTEGNLTLEAHLSNSTISV